jgi:hypothetical protein
MTIDDIDETGRAFLELLYDQTDGDLGKQASMYEIGENLNLDRDASLKTAEILMGYELVEVRNLSGAIGLTHGGISFVEARFVDKTPSNEAIFQLPDEPVLDAESIHRVDLITAELKLRATTFNLDFDSLSELMCDLNCLSTQLASVRPKTAIIRELLKDIRGLLAKTDDEDGVNRISALLGYSLDSDASR